MLTIPTPDSEKARLSALRALGVLDTPCEAELDAITTLAADRFDAPIALISLLDENRQWFKSRVGLEVTETDRSIAFCGYTIQGDDVFVVPDACDDLRFRDNPLVTGDPRIRFYAAAPLALSSGERVGTLCIIDRKPRADFADRDGRALALMAKQVVNHFEMQKLRSEQRISQLIADTTTDAFVCADADGMILYWNRGAQLTFGFTAEEAIGRSLDLIVPPEHQGAHLAGMRRITSGGAPRLVGKTIEVPAVRKDGTRLMIELTLGMWNDHEKGPPTGFTSIMRDVSQRNMTEAKLADRVAAIEAASEGIAIAGTDGIHHYMNEAYLRLFGLPANANDIPWSHLVAPQERDRINDIFLHLADGGSWSGEISGLRMDGSLLDLELSLKRRDQAVVSVVRDISSRRDVSREKARLREQLLVAQRQEAVGQLASGLAHDFNNLIAAISGSAALIRAGFEEDADRHVKRIEAAAADASSLVDKMLSLGKRNPEYQDHDVRLIVRDVCALLRVSLSNEQRVSVAVGDTPIIVTADRTELMQVLLNLGLNARDALRDGSDARIEFGAEPLAEAPQDVALALGMMPVGPLAHFHVADTGTGIAPEEVANIFQPFYTRNKGRGTGLGLAMVSGIVSSAGAGLAIRSVPGEGTRFDIYWPLDPPAELPSHLPVLADQADGSLHDIAILLVDDEPAVVETLAEMFERAGAEVGSCVDARDALAALADDPDAWTLLVTDYDMPGINGAELAVAARAIRADLPILLVTALPDANHARAKEGELFDAISGKFVSVAGLAVAARTAIAMRRDKMR